MPGIPLAVVKAQLLQDFEFKATYDALTPRFDLARACMAGTLIYNLIH